METMGEIPPDMFGTPPLSFSPTKRLGSTLSRLSQIQDGRWKVVSDLREESDARAARPTARPDVRQDALWPACVRAFH
jgi:hypothetical protein